MSRHVFTSAVLLLLVVMMCCGTGGAAGDLVSDSECSKGKSLVWRDKDGETVSSLRVPSLVEVNGDVFAVAAAQCNKQDEEAFTGIASQLLTERRDDKQEEVLNDANTKTQFLEEGTSEGEKKKVDVSRPTTVVQGNDVYMLAGNYSRTAATGDQESGADDSGIFLVKADVSTDGGKKIHWNDTHAVPCTVLNQQQSWTRLVGGGGSGVKLTEDTLVFPVEGTKRKDDKDEETVSLIIYSPKEANSWTLSKGMSADGCGDPSVVEWEKDKLMMMTACADGRRRVYESGDKGESWTEALGTLSRVWSNNQKRHERGVGSGFITATIGGVDDNRNVMLVTLPVYAEENGKGVLHLWLTDNTHIVHIGSVSGDDDAAASSLLYKSGVGNNEELIALYEKKKADEETPSPAMASVRLTTQLERVKEVLKTWKEVDVRVSQLCTNSHAPEGASTGTACSFNFNITDGLVGFLSDNFSETTWKDEYLGMNATIRDGTAAATVAALAAKATKTSDGVTFRGAWAEWPVGKQGENQLYHFANYNFTLVATVSIDGEPTQEGSISLMGVKMNGNENPVFLRLSYNSGGKWKLSCGGEMVKELSSNLEPKKAHQVAIVLQNGNQSSAYVDGKSVGEATCELENKGSKGISHFYIGGDGGSAGSEEGVPVTVANVLLYNRPLSSGEITALNTKLSISKARDVETVTGNTRGPEVSQPTTLAAVSQITVGGQKQTEQESLKASKDTSNGGASTSTVSTGTTSSGGEESVNPSASGTSSDGTQTMDGTSSPDVNPTVGAGRGAGGTVQDGTAVGPEVGVSSGENGEMAGGTGGREEKQIREVNATALSSSLGNLSQANNTDAGTMRESGMMLPSLLLLLGLWGFAAL
ncbi:trans-sialidase, putative [Trypanosoma cruzi marinkellei]|uniref:Trans-sialidase, putative n=2 Tax=Trypanosoma cruzi marinkellei TaxID=85056 RepID=K2N4M6_TRYCR|nr:trans-sialidase, putative [Trypanosoma cruzi marinkellei]